MRLNIRAFPRDETSNPFSGSLDLSHVRWRGDKLFPEPVEVSGMVRRRGDVRHEDIITLDYTVHCTLHATCARCLDDVEKPMEAAFSHVVVEHENKDTPEDWLVAIGGGIDLDDLAAADLLLSMRSVHLCDDDCKGLCPGCGANLNREPCTCNP